MIGGHVFPVADDLIKGHWLAVIAACGNHDAEYAFVDEVGARGTQTCRQQPVGG